MERIVNERIGKIGISNINLDDYNISNNFGISHLDSLSKLGILLVLAGYKQEDDISVAGESLSSYIDIKKFSNLNLNFKKASPRTYDVNVVFENIAKNTFPNENNDKVTIVLLSGGIDSIAGLLYCLDKGEKCIPFWLKFGQRNQDKEEKSVKRITNKLNLPLLLSEIKLGSLVKKEWKRWKLGIIPARNFLITSMIGPYIRNLSEHNIDIYLCASKDEIVPSHNDTSPEFYEQLSYLMSRYYGKNIQVTTPFKKVNKAEIIRYWASNWEKKYGVSIKDAMTCFIGTHCGKCSSCCYRRINALVGKAKDVEFLQDPLLDENGLIKNYYLPNFENWSNERKADFLIALEYKLDILPKYLYKFYLEKKSLYGYQIYKRKCCLEKVELD